MRTPAAMDRNEEKETVQDERSYALYASKHLAFDPMKDLNLPASYDEVLARFQRLQGDREPEALN